MKLVALALVAGPVAADAQTRGVLLAYTTIPTANAPTEPTRTLIYSVYENGRLVAAPVLELEEGITSAVPAGRYALRVRIDRATSPDGETYVVRSSVHRPLQLNWALIARPELTVARRQSAMLSVTTPDGDRFSVHVELR